MRGRAVDRDAVAPVRPAALAPHTDGGAAARVLALQQSAGNQAVSHVVSRLAIQRHAGPTLNEEVGAAAADEATSQAVGETGTGTTGTGTATKTGPERKKAIEDALDASDTGKWALGVVKKHKVPVDYEYTGTGSFHRGGSIYINKSLSVGAAALVMMHEAQHADTFKSGKQADRTKLDRAEYVKQSIADEAEAVVRQIEGMAVTKGLGLDIAGSGMSDALKERYLKAFYKKRDELKAANPSMSTGEVNALCRTHTRDTEVTNWFHDGTFITSTDKNSYADFYGKQWDDVHKAPGK